MNRDCKTVECYLESYGPRALSIALNDWYRFYLLKDKIQEKELAPVVQELFVLFDKNLFTDEAIESQLARALVAWDKCYVSGRKQSKVFRVNGRHYPMEDDN